MTYNENRLNVSLLKNPFDTGLAALAGLMGTVSFPILTVTVALKSEAFHPVSSGLSELVLGPGGWLQAVAFIILSVSLAILCRALRLKLSGRNAGTGIRFLHLAALCMFMLSIVPTEADPAVWSINRFVHVGFSAGTAVAFPLGCLFLSRCFKDDPQWRGLAFFTLATAAVSVFANTLSLLAFTNLEITGLQQMITLGAGLGWMGVVSVRLFRSCSEFR